MNGRGAEEGYNTTTLHFLIFRKRKRDENIFDHQLLASSPSSARTYHINRVKKNSNNNENRDDRTDAKTAGAYAYILPTVSSPPHDV